MTPSRDNKNPFSLETLLTHGFEIFYERLQGMIPYKLRMFEQLGVCNFSKSTSRSMTVTKRKPWMLQLKLLDTHPRCLKNITYCNEVRVLGSQNVQGALGSPWKGSGRGSSHYTQTIQKAPRGRESQV